jgi:predicted  nucleic acid-binding Zn-ribbon protein
MTTTERERTAPVQPGSDRWRELVLMGIVKDAQRNWFLGQAALEILPMGEGNGKNGRDALLAAYADEVGIEAGTLRDYRQVAHAWPAEDRSSATSWRVHKMFMGRRELIEADGPGVRITVTRAHDLLGYHNVGRTGPKSSPEAKARQVIDNLGDPAVMAEVLADSDLLARLLSEPAAAEEVRRWAAQQIAAADAENTRLHEELEAALSADTADERDEAHLSGALDEAAEKIAELQRSLDRAAKRNERLADDASATKAAKDKAQEDLVRVRKDLREAWDAQAKYKAELEGLRQDPERVQRAAAKEQYDWVMRGLHRAIQALSEVDNRLDTEPSVLDGERQGATLQAVDALSMKLTVLRSKLGGSWNADDLANDL